MLKIKKIKPMFTAIVTTMDKYDNDIAINGIIENSKTKGSIKEYQKVVAVGDSVRGINVGDLVTINPTNYMVRKYSEGSIKDGIQDMNPVVRYNFPVVEMDGKEYLLLQDRDISYIIEDYEEIPDMIITQKKPEIIKPKILS